MCLKNNCIYVIIEVLILLGIVAYFLFFQGETKRSEIFTQVKQSKFEIWVVTTGELRSREKTKISIPQGLRQIGIYQIKIAKLIPEGTIVKKGDFVASLDNSEVLTKLNSQQLNLNQLEAKYKQDKLDTMLKLRAARQEITNLRYQLKEKKLEKEQSKYEAPAVIQQVELAYKKSERTLKQKKENYKAQELQAKTKMEIVGTDLQRNKNKIKKIEDILSKLSITAPKGGMLIYERSWNGIKETVGSTLRVFGEGTVATLPDLSKMEVLTYVNEVDIQKVHTGQEVEIGVDAMPGKQLKGVVKSVASIGQQKPTSDAKVFEVKINVLSKDSTLRPGMTTSCKILSKKYKNGLQIPLEAIHNDQSKSFVFKLVNAHPVKQQIKVAAVNETDALLSNGLEKGDKVFLSLPKDTSGLNWIALNPKDQIPLQPMETKDTVWLHKKKGKVDSGQQKKEPKSQKKRNAAL